jgi:hypothetical protein
MSDAARSIPRVVQEQTPSKESRNARFRRLATKRMQNAQDDLDRIGDLATLKSAYTTEEARAIVAALRAWVDEVETRLVPNTTEFKFE